MLSKTSRVKPLDCPKFLSLFSTRIFPLWWRPSNFVFHIAVTCSNVFCSQNSVISSWQSFTTLRTEHDIIFSAKFNLLSKHIGHIFPYSVSLPFYFALLPFTRTLSIKSTGIHELFCISSGSFFAVCKALDEPVKSVYIERYGR